MDKDGMDNVDLQKVRDLIENNNAIGILVGKNPNQDSMGAALALYLSLSNSHKKVTIACPEDPIVEISSLVGIDKVTKSLGVGKGDLIVSFPYKEGEMEKVSYTIEGGYLNIIVKAAESGLSFSEEEVRYERERGLLKVLFIVGTERLSDLGNLFNPQALKNTTVINIDNKENNQGFGNIVLVSPMFSSVSEQVAHLITSLQLGLDLDSAQNLLSGISYATDNFQKPQTSPLAFEMAAMFLKKGAKRKGDALGRKIKTQPDESDFMLPDTDILEEAVPRQNKIDKTPPPDWLIPKVYKGSTSI